MSDLKERYLKAQQEERKKQLEKHSKTIKDFITLCSEIGLKLTSENFSYIETIGIVAKYPNLLFHLKPELKKVDEELIECKSLEKHFEKKNFNSGMLYSDKFIAMAHPYFRRSLSEYANFAPRFIDLFWKFKDDKVKTYIALDANRVRINVDDSAYSELDTWYGGSFKKQIEKISDGVVKIRPPGQLDETDISFFFNEAYSLDIKWNEKSGIKTFQAEEFKTDKVTINIGAIEYYPVRYIHAEYDIKNKHFRHFDGAIHFYEKDEYFQRRDSDLNFNEKIGTHLKARTYKLFKMNKNVSIDTWITYTSHFCTGNPLVFEYFEGKYPDHIQNLLNKIVNKASG
ncbi:hypothetical protein [Christiangramia sp. SM2212]|uniref:Uncharacterized protein n=1 Tax=Christiangramia sediminicola TaxID=3073267 RepID=A0ABU1ERV9_9FLAO|nr:hypothetical protein [Christiangramia sp. SM2212]MDR5591134.1 hypothetical protein [Christiangramia sp. SM2212]